MGDQSPPLLGQEAEQTLLRRDEGIDPRRLPVQIVRNRPLLLKGRHGSLERLQIIRAELHEGRTASKGLQAGTLAGEPIVNEPRVSPSCWGEQETTLIGACRMCQYGYLADWGTFGKDDRAFLCKRHPAGLKTRKCDLSAGLS